MLGRGSFLHCEAVIKEKKGDEIYDKLRLSSHVTFFVFAGLVNIL